jgi:hypothetical protein
MAIAALPGHMRPRVARLRRAVTAAAARLATPAKPVLRNAAAIPLTIAGWGCVAACVFELNVTAGLGVLGVILMVVEHQIADEP